MVRGKKILLIASAAVIIIITVFAAGNLKKAGTGNQDASLENLVGLKVDIMQYGSGDKKVQDGSYVLIRYTGKLQSGEIFVSNLEEAEPFGTFVKQGTVIEALRKGMLGMRVNEKRRIIAASEWAYGDTGSGDGKVPANATVIYEVHLLDIVE